MSRASDIKKKNEEAHLTAREIEIIKLIEKELSNKQIAEKLFLSERTVETHRKNIFRKTNTSSVIGLVKYAYEHKLIWLHELVHIIRIIFSRNLLKT